MEILKSALNKLINISETVDESLEDNHISLGEKAGIAISGLGLIGVIRDRNEILKEFLELSFEEKQELAAWFTEEFDFINDNVEEIVEQIFAELLNINDLFTIVGSLK